MSKRPEILKHWEEVQHDPLTIPPDDFEGMDTEDAVALIKSWFGENFEDPVETTPYISAEGGYQYIWGGPYNTRDIIENVFADSASDELIAAAIQEIEHNATEWVPNSNRRQPPEEDELPEPTDAAALHAEMHVRIAALEQALAHLPSASAGIGHNHPPEPIEDVPLNYADREDLAKALAVLKAQPVAPPQDDSVTTVAAVATVTAQAEKAQSWLSRQLDVFASEAVKEAGKEFGKWAPRVFWGYVVSQLLGLSDVAIQWLHTFHWPF